MKKKNVFIVSALLFLMVEILSAQIPQTISYQGVLADANGNVLPDGSYNLSFRIYDDSTATEDGRLWAEGQLVLVQNGIFNVILGSVQALNLPFSTPYWLGVKVGVEPELQPRIKLTTSPYSFNARSVEDGAITSSKIQEAAIQNTHLAAGAVTTEKINADFISTLDGVSNKGGNIDLVEGNNVTITANDNNNSITISASAGVSADNDWTVSGNNMYSAVSGNIGIGTNSPQAKLDVRDKIRVYNNSGSRYIEIESSEVIFTRNNGPSRLRCIESGGYLTFGVNGAGDTNADATQIIHATRNTSFKTKVVINTENENPTYPLEVNGNIQADNVVAPSDIRFKKNVSTLKSALDKVSGLRGVNYNWKTGEFEGRNFSDEAQVGLIAQEVESIVPEVVSTDRDGYKAIKYAKLVPLLIEAIKELKLQNQKLEERLSALEK